MADYTLMTDSSCDISDAMLAEWQVRAIQMDVLVEGEESQKNNAVDIPTFYQKLRDGKTAKTSAINIADFREFFAEELKQGRDILYIAFSSGLSTTYQSSEIAAEELRAEYPDRKILTVSTLAASMGQGLLVYLAVQQKKKGASMEEVYQYVLDNRLKLCHWFTVDDLFFLKRGGRVSGTVALVGTMLGIKPVLHVDDEGHLINMSKVRGRAAAIQAVAQKFDETALQNNDIVFISHGDCLEDAKTLEGILKQSYGVKNVLIGEIGPVIGAHSGPGTLALFFLGSHR